MENVINSLIKVAAVDCFSCESALAKIASDVFNVCALIDESKTACGQNYIFNVSLCDMQSKVESIINSGVKSFADCDFALRDNETVFSCESFRELGFVLVELEQRNVKFRIVRSGDVYRVYLEIK